MTDKQSKTMELKMLTAAAKQTLATANAMHPQHLQGLKYIVKVFKSIAPVLIEQMKRSK